MRDQSIFVDYAQCPFRGMDPNVLELLSFNLVPIKLSVQAIGCRDARLCWAAPSTTWQTYYLQCAAEATSGRGKSDEALAVLAAIEKNPLAKESCALLVKRASVALATSRC